MVYLGKLNALAGPGTLYSFPDVYRALWDNGFFDKVGGVDVLRQVWQQIMPSTTRCRCP